MQDGQRIRAVKWWVLSIALVTSGCAVDPVSEERALQGLWAKFERAFNDGDAVAAAKLYATDSDRIGSNGVKVSGREAIEKKYGAMLERRAADPSSKPFHATIEVRLLRPDVALLDGSWSGARAGKPVRGFFTLTATKQQGRWLIAAGRDRGVVVE
ncbi:MAG: hypothetical protein ACJAYX_004250 [Planctomycetota bacterium]|jgi:uncharacterized protein (TIGR02246 family)